jgi:hypothetical protein
MSRTLVLAIAATLGGSLLAVAQPTLDKTVPRYTGVKKYTKFPGNKQVYEGVVGDVGKRTMTLRGSLAGEEKATWWTFDAVDVLADGGLLDGADGPYLWSDMKKGDTVLLYVVRDDDEQKPYVVAFIIYRRPGGKLPPSQDPKWDRLFADSSLLNDIDNGEDVSDDDIAKVFPPLEIPGTPGQPPPPPRPGGLSEKYQKKLDAIRAKKAKEGEKKPDLKAPPPLDKK